MFWIVVFVAASLLLFYLVRSQNVDYWKKKGVPSVRGNWFFGNFADLYLGKKHHGVIFDDLYRRFPNSPVVGYLNMSTPELMIRDPDLVKAVLVTEFNHFGRNQLTVDKKVDFLLGNNPFVLQGDEWKTSRSHVTPSLTFNRLKNYFPSIVGVGEEMVKYIDQNCKATGCAVLEAKKLSEFFTTDVISNAICGIANNTFEDEKSLFATLTREIFATDFLNRLKLMATVMFPDFSNYFSIRFSTKRTEKILLALTRKMMKERVESGDVKHDIFQLMVSHRNNGKADVYTDEYIASHLYGFVLDGYETSSILISYTLFELAWNEEIQKNLRLEVTEMIKRTDGNYTAEDAEALKYLDMVISETIRLHPPALGLSKVCTEDFVLQNIEGLSKPYTIKKDQTVIIPLYSLHMDPQYYPDPKKFDPDRFTEEEVAKRHKYVYLPFGEGPRKCFGQRFGLLQSKLAVIKIISNFRLTPSDKTSYDIQINPKVPILNHSLNGLWITMHPIH